MRGRGQLSHRVDRALSGARAFEVVALSSWRSAIASSICERHVENRGENGNAIALIRKG